MKAPPNNLLRLSLTYWVSGKSHVAWFLALLVIGCTVVIVSLNLALNNWQAGFYNQLQAYDRPGFHRTLLQFLLISTLYILTSGYQSYGKLLLQLRWRQWLTDVFTGLWLANRTYYHLNLLQTSIDNPGQRISEDIRIFINTTVDIVVDVLRHLTTLAVFSTVLWQLSGTLTLPFFPFALPGYLLWLALFYSLTGTWFTFRAGLPLVSRNVVQQTAEADFRSHLDHLGGHDESVALYRGEATEQITLTRHFRRLAQNYLAMAKATKNLTLLSVAYSQLSIVFAFLVSSPRYFSNEIQLGQLFEISGAYWYVHASLSYMVENFNKLALWKAVHIRLTHFIQMMSAVEKLAKAEGTTVPQKANQFELKNVTLFSPTGDVLQKNISCTLRPQEHLLISGPPGCGKTTLLRTIAGIWPHFSGLVLKPGRQSQFFLPQTPYLFKTTLRELLLYPQHPPVSDEVLQELLICCQLPALYARLNEYEDWPKSLSLGQQQCLSLIRAILHKPAWLFLDEATASLDPATEERLYACLRQKLPATTLISVGHRKGLLPYHQRHLQLRTD